MRIKKNGLSIILMILVLNVYSQTPLESNVFQKINDYRVENGLHRLKWDDATYKSTQIHTEYMIKHGKLSHIEDSETPTFASRLMLFQDNNYILGNECVLRVSVNHIEDSIDDISNKIVNGWMSSEGHNRAMLNKGATAGAISCGDGTKFKNGRVLKMKYATLVVWLKPI